MDALNIFPTEMWRNGPKPGSVHHFPGSVSAPNNEKKCTLSPMTTGSSVLGVKFAGGVMIAADTLGSYGSLARFRNCSRVMKVNDVTVLGAGGDYADYQFMKSIIEQKIIDEDCQGDGFNYTPKALFNWITRVTYNRRSNFNPLWNTFVVGGLQDGEPYLGYIDKIGTAYTGNTIASGFGAYLAQPLMRECYESNPAMSEEEAQQLIDRCIKVLYYRDARSWNKYEIAVVTKDGVTMKGPLSPETDWIVAKYVKGYE